MRRQAYPFSSRMICSIVHEGKREREKKKRRQQGLDLQVNPLPSFAHRCLPWTLGLNFGWPYQPRVQPYEPVERPFFVAHSESDNFSSSPDFEA